MQRAVRRAVRSLTDAQGLTAAEEIFAGRRSVPARMVYAARQEMNSADAAAGVERLVSRDLDHRRLEAVARPAAA